MCLNSFEFVVKSMSMAYNIYDMLMVNACVFGGGGEGGVLRYFAKNKKPTKP